MKKLFAALSALTVFAVMCTAFYFLRQIDVFGSEIKANSREILFEGNEITGFEPLTEYLDKFPFLEHVALGNFPVFPEQAEKLSSEYPEIKFDYTLCKRLCGKTFPADSVEIDLSDTDSFSADELSAGLAEFENVKAVNLGDKVLKYDEKKELENAYPDVNFICLVKYDIYGSWICEDVTEIDLSGVEVDSELENKLSLFENLKKVNLSGVSIDEERKLTLAECFPDTDFAMSAYLAGKEFETSTDFIDLNFTPIYDLEAFERSLKLFRHVEKIEMCGCYVSNEDMAALCEKYPNIKFVWRVYMGRWSVRTDAVAFSVLIADYSHKRLTSADIEVLKYCPDLEALDLGHQALTDISCIPEYMPKLKVLILADNMISDLTPLAKLKHLHYLEFFVNRVTDLSPLAECRELVDLNISYNYGIKDITPLLDLPLLERLWMEHVSVSQADINLLRETYPDATIINVGKGSIDQGWRGHERYYAMIDMYYNDYISDSFTKYDGLICRDD